MRFGIKSEQEYGFLFLLRKMISGNVFQITINKLAA
jgi:hypothetical protein